MDKPEINITVRFAWWFKAYVFGIWLTVRLFKMVGVDVVPNPDKVEYWASRAVRIVAAKRVDR